MRSITIKSQLIVFLALFGLYLSFINRDAQFLFALLAAVISAAAVDTALAYLKTKKPEVTESSLISGLIIGFVLSSDSPLWIICLASIVAIGSKHLVRFKGRHIFNPAALGIFSVIILLGAKRRRQKWHR